MCTSRSKAPYSKYRQLFKSSAANTGESFHQRFTSCLENNMAQEDVRESENRQTISIELGYDASEGTLAGL